MLEKPVFKPQFKKELLAWFATHHRAMPWKGEKNPYLIWLSEIILQQTRVEQGLPYFEKFAATYPTITDLANAPEDAVFKLWEGLGYYSRARNLHATAKYIAYQLSGVFPTNYKNILALKGVGTYTAAAIASFAYGLPYAVLDGNVYRVLSRVFGIATAIDSTEGKKTFTALADELLDTENPADYNQAIMDFGATVCTPKKPNCTTCPFQPNCSAFANKNIADLPFKSKKIKKTDLYLYYFVFNYNGNTWIKKRTAKDIWQDLYDFPSVDFPTAQSLEAIQLQEHWQYLVGGQAFDIQKVSKPYTQLLTHKKVIAVFWEIALFEPLHASEYLQITKKNMLEFAFPKIVSNYLQDKSLYLELF